MARTAPAPCPSPTDLPKNFDPTASERALYEWWESSGFFAPDETSDKEPFVVSMPPPNVTGALHMGHGMFVTLQDIMARFQRMRGRPTLWLPGTDHAGIATQLLVERKLAEEGVSKHDLGREAFEERVWEWKAEYGGRITGQLRRLGASCDWEQEAFTLDPALCTAVAESFVRLHEKGLVYRGDYMVNWSPNLRTAVSDLEVEYSEEEGKMYYFKYPLADGSGALTVATTRPETIMGDQAVCVHPEDPRFSDMVGKECRVPFTDRTIPVLADDYVDMEFGTGCLKVTPGHDVNDYEIGKRLGLPTLNIMNEDATLNENGGRFAGMDRFEAREALWAAMEEEGLAVKTEAHVSRVPRSQRGGEVIEPLVSTQWFVKMEPLAGPALEAVRSGEVKFVPERFEKTYYYWLENIRDWCVSRQLWWGHRIPVWYVDAPGASEEQYFVARDAEDAQRQARAALGVAEGEPDVPLRQETDVLDTWYSSGLWPFSTVGWPDEGSAKFQKYYPSSVMETGHDILFFWVARMMMMGIEMTGKPPFDTIYLHGLVRDEKGRKMSKTIGNVVDPLDVVAEYGADPLRYTLVTGTTPGQDVNLSMDRLSASRNFLNKVWQAGKFVLLCLEECTAEERAAMASAPTMTVEEAAELPLAERWIVGRTHELVAHVTKQLDKLDFGEAGRALYEFLWNDFADWYVEIAKTRTYGHPGTPDAAVARRVLCYCYERFVRMLHPVMPYVTEEMWQALPHDGDSVMVAAWPEAPAEYTGEGAGGDAGAERFAQVQAVVRAVRNARAEYEVAPGKRIPAVVVASNEAVLADLDSERAALAFLAKLEVETLQLVGTADAPSAEELGDCARLVVGDGVEVVLPMSGLVDVAVETERLTRQATKLEKTLAQLDGRLGSDFSKKAPAKVVEATRAEAEEARSSLEQVRARLEELAAM